DDKGLVLPPKLAPTQVVIVPILFDDSKKQVLKLAEDLKQKLEKQKILVHLDGREDYTPGWKFNEWEVKGVPVRIEIGPKDLAKKNVTIVQRDTGEKKSVPVTWVEKGIGQLLDEIQLNLYNKAQENLKSSIVEVSSNSEAETAFKKEKIIFAKWCGTTVCEEKFKEKTGAKSLNSPLQQPVVSGKCFNCEKKAEVWFYFGKSY
ncbi:MAG TPA: His/Gly/Thr/Pro-type tRNA ligase C-terminal domain-containing protein, partial [Candidatus Nanoarchaeia archaeon]|nr:His/Gly/Thr/Pro-type tRNA ligase C-terminal domain-containing protein [Candidatus Nanoarchaeia archaeon]